MMLPPGHFTLSLQPFAQQVIEECAANGGRLVRGELQGRDDWAPIAHSEVLVEAIMPVSCPNGRELEIPDVWGAGLEHGAWASFTNLTDVRRT